MDLHKIHHPDNFDFVARVERASRGGARVGHTEARRVELTVSDLGEDVFRLEMAARGTPPRRVLAPLEHSFRGASRYRLELGAHGELSLAAKPPGRAGRAPAGKGAGKGAGGAPPFCLRGAPGKTLGLSGDAFLLRFLPEAGERFFGMGEKWGPLEKSGQRSQFWNTDVWADYTPTEIGDAKVDSPYASIPYLVMERGGVFAGILLDTAHRAFMATNPEFSLGGGDPNATEQLPPAGNRIEAKLGHLYLGATGGRPIVYFLVGPTLRELTKKLQRLVGTTPRPPLWALGHQQSRWGYGDAGDLAELDAKFAEHRIPTDGLWLDIDYMHGYRVFTAHDGVLDERLVAARARRRRVVPILDPGVKVDPGYSVYEEGLRGGYFCLNPVGKPYVGVVWPGATHFPDFSLTATRAWWTSHVERFAARGFDAFWIDMNDPSTGPIDNTAMLFQKGKWDHEAFHNQYGTAMAEATREGLLAARPRERPFVLSRSASTGAGRFTALWTGDNVSSFRHLEASIPTSLNLALSGIPFNGPDVPGFGADASDELAVRFYQATALFPFQRNHSVKGSRRQEPWAFDASTLEQLGRIITLRYRMLPFLYQLFIEQERTGAPILAPLFIDGPSTGSASGRGEARRKRSGASAPDLSKIEDQFFVGQLLVAPVVKEGARRRAVVLPARTDTPASGRSGTAALESWYSLTTGAWYAPGQLDLAVPLGDLPLFVEAPAVLPLSRRVIEVDGGVTPPALLLGEVDFHLVLRDGESRTFTYEIDDGLSFAYASGQVRLLELHVERRKGEFRVDTALGEPSEARRERQGRRLANQLPIRARFVLHGIGPQGAGSARLIVNGESVALRRAKERFSGKPISVLRSGEFAY